MPRRRRKLRSRTPRTGHGQAALSAVRGSQNRPRTPTPLAVRADRSLRRPGAALQVQLETMLGAVTARGSLTARELTQIDAARAVRDYPNGHAARAAREASPGEERLRQERRHFVNQIGFVQGLLETALDVDAFARLEARVHRLHERGQQVFGWQPVVQPSSPPPHPCAAVQPAAVPSVVRNAVQRNPAQPSRPPPQHPLGQALPPRVLLPHWMAPSRMIASPCIVPPPRTIAPGVVPPGCVSKAASLMPGICRPT